MRIKKSTVIISCIIAVVILCGFASDYFEEVPKLWDDERVQSVHLPLADKTVELKPISEKLYYQLKEKKAWKTYPLYLPGREPEGYYKWLLQQDPELIFDPSQLKKEEDWVKAGEFLYEMPENYSQILDSSLDMKRMTDLFAEMNAIYAEFFTADFPARSAIQVSALPKGGIVEVEAIAVLPHQHEGKCDCE